MISKVKYHDAISLSSMRSRHRLLRWSLIIFDAISDSMVSYAIGLMQQATLSPDTIEETFSIWAVVLLILSDSYYYDFD